MRVHMPCHRWRTVVHSSTVSSCLSSLCETLCSQAWLLSRVEHLVRTNGENGILFCSVPLSPILLVADRQQESMNTIKTVWVHSLVAAALEA